MRRTRFARKHDGYSSVLLSRFGWESPSWVGNTAQRTCRAGEYSLAARRPARCRCRCRPFRGYFRNKRIDSVSASRQCNHNRVRGLYTWILSGSAASQVEPEQSADTAAARRKSLIYRSAARRGEARGAHAPSQIYNSRPFKRNRQPSRVG